MKQLNGVIHRLKDLKWVIERAKVAYITIDEATKSTETTLGRGPLFIFIGLSGFAVKERFYLQIKQ
jgi:hypothetical protein